ncbi:MAG TPA: energy transducer TonB [Candidatus Dormibacteraeota bacterium]|nr:energy transducer TonB [Candidatus Dormibacteraeota bacterium]
MQISPVFGFARLISFLIISVLVAILLLVEEPAYAQDQEKDIDHLADQLAESLATTNVKKILVLDFNAPDQSLKDAAKFVTARTALALGNQKQEFKIVEQRHLSSSQAAKLPPPGAPLSNDVLEVFRQLADAVVTGNLLQNTPDTVAVAVEVSHVATGERLAAFEIPIPRSMLPDSPAALTLNSPESLPMVPGQDNVNIPRCLDCQTPQYTGETRARGRQGTVNLQVIVSEDGRALQIGVIKMLGYGLDEIAIEAVRKWSFEPTTKAGRPVPVILPIEITFRLF